MKIGTCLRVDTMEGIEEKLLTLKENQFDACQLVCWEPAVWKDENAAVLHELLEKYGITVSAFWCGWEGPRVWNFYDGQLTLGLVPVEYRQMRIQNLCDGADFAKKLGIENVVTHMGFIPENPYDPNFASLCVAIRTVAQHLKANGQYLLFETGQETPVAMLRCFEQVGCDNLGVNLDTANLIMYGKANPVDSLKVFGKYVRNLHAKDGLYPVNGHDLGKETKIGEGEVDFRGVFQKLHELGYDSHVTIENELRDGEELIEILRSRDYLQKLIDEIYVN
ncbi:MAG: sugar phosphate isomerase/epimerase [Clostridia bacterium]|nr:sugar phosphate isomerase/epimerase [Clostridia bacterium]